MQKDREFKASLGCIFHFFISKNEIKEREEGRQKRERERKEGRKEGKKEGKEKKRKKERKRERKTWFLSQECEEGVQVLDLPWG
jgi:hypothetical protein